jgi:hypothetical protein
VTDEIAGLDNAFTVSEDDSTGDAGSDIDTLKAQYEERIKGLQRVVSEKDKAIAERAKRERELELQALPPDERYSRLEEEYQKDLREARTELELMRLESRFTKAMPLYKKLVSMETVEAQLEYLESLGGGVEESDSQESGVKPASVDRNPANRIGRGTVMADGRVMDDTFADRVLGAFKKR